MYLILAIIAMSCIVVGVSLVVSTSNAVRAEKKLKKEAERLQASSIYGRPFLVPSSVVRHSRGAHRRAA